MNALDAFFIQTKTVLETLLELLLALSFYIGIFFLLKGLAAFRTGKRQKDYIQISSASAMILAGIIILFMPLLLKLCGIDV